MFRAPGSVNKARFLRSTARFAPAVIVAWFVRDALVSDVLFLVVMACFGVIEVFVITSLVIGNAPRSTPRAGHLVWPGDDTHPREPDRW